MTIEQAILAQLAAGPANLEDIYSYVDSNAQVRTGLWAGLAPFRHSTRARLSRLVKTGRIVRTAPRTYALPKKTRKSRTTTQAAA